MKDGASSSNTNFDETVCQDDLIHAAEHQMTPKLSGLTAAHTSGERDQAAQNFQKDSVSPILTSLGSVWFLKITSNILHLGHA